MKTKYLLLFILLICSLTSKAEEKTVTFDASEDRTDEKTLSEEGITISLVRGGIDFNNYTSTHKQNYKISSGAEFRISSKIGNIKRVKFILSKENDYSKITVDNKAITLSSKKDYAEWTGDLTQITFYTLDTNHFSSIAVTYDRSITMSSSTYATFWCEKAYTMPTGLTGITISGVEDGCVVQGQAFEGGSLVPANTPLLLHGNAGTYAYTTSDDDTAAPAPNMLQCSYGTEVSGSGSYFYKYTYLSATDHTLGFFWDSDDGRSIRLDYGKAFLVISENVAAGVKGFTLSNTWDVTNGIETLKTFQNFRNDTEQTLYDIHGIAHPYSDSLEKGIYITNTGRKIVVR